jgi:hypothetical protein
MEKFETYLLKINELKNSTGSKNTIVPVSGNTNSSATGRVGGTTSQIHAVYVTLVKPHQVSDIESHAVYFHLGIKDISGNTVYICHDVPLLPQSSYFFEKTLTVLPSQELFIEFDSGVGSNNDPDQGVDVYVASVDIS